jgi:porin
MLLPSSAVVPFSPCSDLQRRIVTDAARAAAALALLAPSAGAQSGPDSTPRPIVTSFSYSGQLFGNTGGARGGANVLGLASAAVTLRLGPLLGWHGARLFVAVAGTHGAAPSDRVGDLQGVSNLQAPGAVRLEEAWLQQNLAANHFSLLVGRYDLNAEFYHLQSATLFVNSSFGIGPEFAQSGVAGPSIFPSTSLGARLDVKPSPNAVWRMGVLDGVPLDRPGGGFHPFAAGDGALLVGELAVLARPDTGAAPRRRRVHVGRGIRLPYAGKVAVGGWYYTARFADLSDTLPDGSAVEHRGSRGAYLIADETLDSDLLGGAGPLSAFVQLGLGDRRVNRVGGYVGTGLTLAGPFAGRGQDELGLGAAVALIGSHAAAAARAAGAPAATETALELTYLMQFGSWLSVQPDVQYVVHPGGAAASRNAVVLGFAFAVSH